MFTSLCPIMCAIFIQTYHSSRNFGFMIFINGPEAGMHHA